MGEDTLGGTYWCTSIPGLDSLDEAMVLLQIGSQKSLVRSVECRGVSRVKGPEFVAYCMSLSLLAGMLAVAKGIMF